LGNFFWPQFWFHQVTNLKTKGKKKKAKKMPQNHAKFYISNGNNIGLATTLIELQKWLISYSQILKMFWLGMFTRKQVGLEWWSIGLNDLNRQTWIIQITYLHHFLIVWMMLKTYTSI